MREIIHLNREWEYTDTFSDAFCCGAGAGAIVDLPHTVAVTPFHYFDEKIYQTVCGYRQRLTLPENATGKRVFLIIGAAAHSAKVYVDGTLMNTHRGGYTAFETELTDVLVPGHESVICVRVDSRESQNLPPFGNVVDYMTYGGLYREVRLELRERDCLRDVFVKPSVPLRALKSDKPLSQLVFAGTVESDVAVDGSADCEIRQSIYPYAGDDRPLLSRVFRYGDDIRMTIPGVRLWDVDNPVLYTVRTELIRGDSIIDSIDTTVGFRRSEFRADGYYLNGRKLRLVGLNRHQCYPYVGYAMPRSMQRLDAEIMKNELGLNAVRTSHYPQSHHFLDRCDELGLLVFTEIPGWQHIGDEEWKNIAVGSVSEMVMQYRNHPSIILWGVRINESRDDDAFYRRTNRAAHALDPTRPTGGVRCHKKSSLLEDVYTYNDFLHSGDNAGCERKSDVTPDTGKPYLISEYNGHMYPTKGFDNEELRTEHALRHARVLDAVASHDDIAGSFGWCFFDYNTHRDFGSGDRICYHGVCDMFRNKKLAADVYAVRQDHIPVLSVSSSMDIGEHPASVRGRVFAFTNADSVRFYKNDVLIRTYTHRNSPFSHMTRPPIEISDFAGDGIMKGEGFSAHQAALVKDVLNDAARYGTAHLPLTTRRKAAQLRLRYHMTADDLYRLYGKYIENWGDEASAYRYEAVKDGETVAVINKRFSAVRRLVADVSSHDLIDGVTYDVAAVRLRMTDSDGNTLPYFFGAVQVALSGPLAVYGSEPTLRAGMGGLYLRTTGESGDAVLTLTAEGCEPVVIRFGITAG